MTYRPSRDSLAAQVIGFFALNADEELTLDDVIEKFVGQSDARNVHRQLAEACDHDMLSYDAKRFVYSAGTVAMPSIFVQEDEDEEELDGAGERADSDQISDNSGQINSGNVGKNSGVCDHGRPSSGSEDISNRTSLKGSKLRANGDGANEPGRDVAESEAERALQGGVEASNRHHMGGSERTDSKGVDCHSVGHDKTSNDRELGSDVASAAWTAQQLLGDDAPRAGGVVRFEGADYPRGEKEGKGVSVVATVRQHLLDTLTDLRRTENPMSVDRARAVAEVANVIVNTAKVEVEYLKVTRQKRGAFFELKD